MTQEKDALVERERKLAAGELVRRRRRNMQGGEIFLTPEDAEEYDRIYGAPGKMVSDDCWTGF